MNPAGISMLIHKWWLTKSNQHPGQISIAQKPARTAVLVPKPEKNWHLQDKVSQVLVGMKSKYQLFWLFCNVHVRTSHPGAHSLSCRRLMLWTMNWKAQVQKWSEKQFPRIQNGKKHWFHSHYFTVSSSGLGGFLIYSQWIAFVKD